MTQTTQNKVGILALNADGSFNSEYPSGNKPIFTSGMVLTFTGGASLGSPNMAFSKPLINATAIGATPVNANGFIFNDTVGSPTSFLVANDSLRGKVLANTPAPDAALRFATPAPLAAQSRYYYSFWLKVDLKLSGSMYPYYFQHKVFRANTTNSITDMTGWQTRIFEQNNGASNAPIIFAKDISENDLTPVQYGAANTLISPNNTWAHVEIFQLNSDDNVANGQLVYRVTQGGTTKISKNKTANMNYSNASYRTTHLIEQGYFGNFGIIPDEGTSPDYKSILRDSSTFIQDWVRYDISDSLQTQTATNRQNLSFTNSGADSLVTIDTTGWTSGTYDVFVRKITGIDSNGWDVVGDYRRVRITV